MLNGEILFIIAPSNKDFKDITYQSLVRHLDITTLKTYGFYIFEEDNKNEWNVYENKYLNILNICYEYKDYYDTAIVLSGNIFFNLKTFYSFKLLLDSIISKHFTAKNDLIVGFPYLNNYNNINRYSKSNFLKNYLVDDLSNEYYEILKLYENTGKTYIDLDFCFINLNALNDNIKPFEIASKIQHKNQQILLNSILLGHTQLAKTPNFYFKQNIYESELTSLNTKNALVYKFTENYFPLKKLYTTLLDKNRRLINYHIFNKLYEEYKNIDNSKLNEDLCVYIEDNYIKTSFTESIVAK